MNHYFYLQAEQNTQNESILKQLEFYANDNRIPIYVLEKPLIEQQDSDNDTNSLIVLSPKHKIIFVNYAGSQEEFEDFVNDTIDDVGYISKKYSYLSIIGRPREWRDNLIIEKNKSEISSIDNLFNSCKVSSPKEIKSIDLLISLFIGSINDIEKVKKDVPQTALDKVKQKIQLFDGDQTRFIYGETPNKKIIRIQGLSGTGKTELLLHKLKDIYTKDSNSKIFFTCHSKVLANDLRKRIPSFFNFMKVEEQIEWNQRLWCTRAWGSAASPNSGAYSYICSFYEIPCLPYSFYRSFSQVCQIAIEQIKIIMEKEKKYAFSHMIIDESQDFDENFFILCELVTKKNIYIAGDIFQSIFDENISTSIEPDFLLGKCYRTDPKTLMFAHGLGMGLFEKNKLRWLEKDEWEACGYNVEEIEGNFYSLSREPLRRFEDLEDDYKSIEIRELDSKFSTETVQIIDSIRKENPTVQPDDIGIILLDDDKSIYETANYLERDIYDKLGWKVNKTYESKEKKSGMVLISNRNNVKGLEFPFVICITKKILKNHSYRNSLYTMLTRSFIKSFLLTPKGQLTNGMKLGLEDIMNTQKMKIKEPSPEEKKKIKTSFERQKQRLSLYDTVKKIFEERNLDKKHLEAILNMIKNVGIMESDEETLRSFINDNYKYLNI